MICLEYLKTLAGGVFTATSEVTIKHMIYIVQIHCIFYNNIICTIINETMDMSPVTLPLIGTYA